MNTHDKTTTNPTLADDEDLYGDADRWNITDPDPEPREPWVPKSDAEYKKERDKARRELEERFAPSAFTPRTANAAIRESRHHPPRPLYADLWNQGELLAITGEPNSGKSILATQIAESIARGLQTPHLDRRGARGAGGVVDTPSSHDQKPTNNARPLTTLFLDLEHTDAQFTARYTVPVPFHSRKTKTYRFSSRLKRPRLNTLEVPEVYEGRLAESMLHSLHKAIEHTQAEVIVIDNLTLLETTGRPAALYRWMRYLRRLAHEDNLSILVTYPIPTRSKTASSQPFRIPHSAFRILHSADRILALSPTTIAPDHRYLKVLKGANSQTPHLEASEAGSQTPHLDRRGAHGVGGAVDALRDPHNVMVFKLERTSAPNSPPYQGGVAPAAGDGVVLSSSTELITGHRPPTTPFLGFQFLGLSPERLHLIDYEAQARQLYPRQPGRPSKKEEVVEMLLDPAYGRYLRGEK